MKSWMRLVTGLSLGVFFLFAAEARAACRVPDASGRVAGLAPRVAVAEGLQDFGGGGSGHESLAGLWNAEFLIGEGPDLYDHSFQQFHGDGTELMLSNGLPPALGNVCVGVWKQTGPRTFKLKHMAWNWTEDGKLAGTFLMEVTFRLDRRGARYSGTWKADSFDLANNLIPDLHAEGVARATRIGVD